MKAKQGIKNVTVNQSSILHIAYIQNYIRLDYNICIFIINCSGN